jgi:peptide/nickel transport system substrate-binding protein
MKRRLPGAVAPLTALLLATSLVGGCEAASTSSNDSSTAPQVLRWASSSQPKSLDPRKAASFDPMFLLEVYDPLIRRDAKGELVPALATEWKLSEDAKTLELTLREGVKFQDGAPFDAEAVKANIEAAKKPGFTTTGSLATVESVEVVDPTHVTLHMSAPRSDMLNILAGEAGMMISPKAIDSPDLERKPVGAGPFTVSTYNQSSLVYDKWDGYWDAKNIALDQINMSFLLDEQARLRAIKSGQADAGPIRSNQKEEAKAAGLEFTEGNAAFVYGLMLNTDRSELGNPLVRKALIHAIDRDAINKAFFDGDCTPVVQPFPPDFWAHVDGLEDSPDGNYDPEKAKQLLVQAGLPNGFTMDMYMGTAPTFQSVAQAIQAQLAKVGIKVKLTAMENTALAAARSKGEFTSSFASIQSGRPDPSQFIQNFYLPGGLFNPGDFSLDGVAENLQKVREVSDTAARKGPMSNIIKDVLAEGPPMIPVCSALVVWAHNDKVKNLEIAVNYDYEFRSVKMADDR